MNPRKLLVTFFGAGLSPVAPGTAGSLATAALLYAVAWAGPSYLTWTLVLAAGLAAASAITVALGPWAAAHFGREDPQPVVTDEVAGVCLTLMGLPVVGPHAAWTVVAAFVAFRLFDVTKPPPARNLEHLPAGWGVLCDDLAAAVYANVACQLFLRLVL